METSSLRILLVEDDRNVAAALETCLREAGHEVLAVEARGDITLTATRLLQPDVVVLNVQLRGPLDGHAVVTALRQSVPTPVPVVFVATSAELPAARDLQQLAPLAILAGQGTGVNLQRALASALSFA
ncbi:response regulator [Hymenobacter sp. ASUV-10]|uniref:Response regulator n=1 Tax=Hymenobacter aranciens TaxID=3063996 RepID=A0ABT9BFX3_9BACT|nr:response regulator [Hymenobacter sp. ASUV-10]MDO7876563.1 response regulator [Hymenobacter sp. ASUV-10]